MVSQGEIIAAELEVPAGQPLGFYPSDVGEFLVTYDEFFVDALAARVADVKASLAKDLSRYRAHAEGARMANRLAEPDAV